MGKKYDYNKQEFHKVKENGIICKKNNTGKFCIEI